MGHTHSSSKAARASHKLRTMWKCVLLNRRSSRALLSGAEVLSLSARVRVRPSLSGVAVWHQGGVAQDIPLEHLPQMVKVTASPHQISVHVTPVLSCRPRRNKPDLLARRLRVASTDPSAMSRSQLVLALGLLALAAVAMTPTDAGKHAVGRLQARDAAAWGGWAVPAHAYRPPPAAPGASG